MPACSCISYQIITLMLLTSFMLMLTFKKSMQYKQLRCFVNLSVHVLVCVFSLKSIVGDKRRMIWIFGCVITQILNDCSVILLTT